jgi:BirA family biotin operon repressor/biotin-[acetyl-CoA-carboxylase] ligase
MSRLRDNKNWMPSQLNLAAIRSALIGTRFAAHLHLFASVSSTNTLLLASAAEGAPEGTVYLADEQTAGRGRSDHSWHSASGEGLYLSALVKPSLPLRDALLLSLATGLAAAHAIGEVTNLKIDLRWPNDLMLAGKKLGGILVETASETGEDAPLSSASASTCISAAFRPMSPRSQPRSIWKATPAQPPARLCSSLCCARWTWNSRTWRAAAT